MLLEPNAIVLYVDNLSKASQFYQDILGIRPEEASSSFHAFHLSKGMNLALKTRDTIIPPLEGKNSNGGELAFTVDNPAKVDALFTEWKARGISTILAPTVLPFGYTFVALDLDGNRLRVACMEKPS